MLKKRVVIIEDNAAIREGFAAVLGLTAHYEVVGQYSQCESALKKLATDAPDLVLMDIELPGMDGIEGTTRIKKQLPTCLVIIITVYEDSQKVFRSLCAGAGGYLIKNANVETIVSSLDEALAGGAPMSLSIARLVVQSFQQQPNSPLSARESQVLEGIAQGKSYTKIAHELFISKETVRGHIKNIYQKLAVNSKADALRIAQTNQWLKRNW